MRSDFLDYDLPRHLIAQQPCAERDHSRLLLVRRAEQALEHHVFYELPDLLDPGDLLVLNDSRVLPARLLGRRARTGGQWEGLFLSADADGTWELLCQTRGRLTEGELIQVKPGPLHLELVGRRGGHWLARPSEPGPPVDLLTRHGQVPLPPYIRKGRGVAADRERYQTIYARLAGSVAAPTAGLHFTPALAEALASRGIEIVEITLHVGYGTFQPVRVERVEDHRLEPEHYEISEAAAAAINRTLDEGRRVIAVGTTTTRTLEAVAQVNGGRIAAGGGSTDLFIYPGFAFKVIGGLLTNFHLPQSSLLMLVAAFAGRERVLDAYRAAVAERYRFYSYGDAMLVT
jgi:S-adenosylmethionine:tRNA ribosyltransferase-isomerase